MREFLRTWKRYFLFAAVLSCFVNILQLTFPLYMFTIYRNIVVSYSWVSLSTITWAAFYALIVLGFFTYVRSRLLAAAGKDLSQSLRESVYTGMIRGAAGPGKGTYRQGLSDLETVRNYFSNSGIYALFDAPWAPLYLLLIFFFHPVLGMIATTGAGLMFGLSVLQELMIRGRMRQANAKNSRNQRFTDSFLRNAEVINGMGMIGSISRRFERDNKEVIQNQTVASDYAGAIQSVIKPMQNVLQVLIYGSGAYFVLTAGFSVGLMVASAIIMGRALAPIMQVMGAWKFTLQAKDAYHRLDQFITQQEQAKERMPLPAPQGNLDLDRVGLTLGGRVLLRGISLQLRAGEFMGLLGPSGAGKTTLCRLILGLWPSMGGKVRLDGTDIFAWDQDQLGPYIGYLPQEVEVFPGTVADNIARMGRPDPEKLEKAAGLSGMDRVIAELPQGEETLLETQGGVRLSGGQKQRLGLARALYGDPRLLVLDEPSSNLDEAGEQELMGTLQSIKEQTGSTCIMVTHKPQLLQSMDRILMLRNGRVALFGDKNEVFARLSRGQSPRPGPSHVIRSGA